MDPNTPDDDLWAPPNWLKNVYYWSGGGSAVAFAIAILLTWLGAEAQAQVVAWAAVVVLFITNVAHRAMRRVYMATINAEEALEKDPHVHSSLATALRRARRATTLTVSGAVFLALCALLAAGFSPLHEFLQRKIPKHLSFSSLQYLDRTREPLIKNAPFLEGTVAYLMSEAPSKIVIGTTVPYQHPTLAFRAQLLIDTDADGKPIDARTRYDFAAYVFRRHYLDGRLTYDPLTVGYSPDKTKILLTLPASASGDDLLIVGRLSLLAAKEFPSTPGEVLKWAMPD